MNIDFDDISKQAVNILSDMVKSVSCNRPRGHKAMKATGLVVEGRGQMLKREGDQMAAFTRASFAPQVFLRKSTDVHRFKNNLKTLGQNSQMLRVLG